VPPLRHRHGARHGAGPGGAGAGPADAHPRRSQLPALAGLGLGLGLGRCGQRRCRRRAVFRDRAALAQIHLVRVRRGAAGIPAAAPEAFPGEQGNGACVAVSANASGGSQVSQSELNGQLRSSKSSDK
jgi:hypothetical protein